MYYTPPHFLSNFTSLIQRTSDRGNESYKVSLPMILKKIEVDQMLQSSYACTCIIQICCLVQYFMILHLGSCFNKCTALFLAEMVIFHMIHTGSNRKLKTYIPPQNILFLKLSTSYLTLLSKGCDTWRFRSKC